jgi:hypothetical protein
MSPPPPPPASSSSSSSSSSPWPSSTAEHARLRGADAAAWRRFGPYVAERSWGTVREDYSADGDAWAYFPHDHARSRAYRWGEDGLAAICDRYQVMVFAFAFWNERDPILKERLFGVVPTEGNHGEDVKELYYYLDSTPTHSYMRWLYKYPQRPYPYARLVDENRRRGGRGPEFELLETGVFDEDRYFDLFVEYAKAGPDDLVVRLTAHNRGPDPAPLHVLPQLWFRNTWGWGPERLSQPAITRGPSGDGFVSLLADDREAPRLRLLTRDYRLGERYLYLEEDAALLFTDNETNGPRVFGPGAESASPYTKDAFHRHLVDGEPGAINPALRGTKGAGHVRRVVPPGGRVELRLRLCAHPLAAPFADADRVLAQRRAEADEFYAAVQPPAASDDEKLVQRQAFAGLLWTKQIYLFDVETWLAGDNPRWPAPRARQQIRNTHWRHLTSMRILSMPDKWEYPWFAAWDLAFHAVTFAIIDPEFAKEQLWLLLFEQFLHPSGQIPAYEWEFSDLNPPVHAWAVWRVYNMDRIRSGKADRGFLERCFHKLLLNFAFWVNKVDVHGNNVFEGGFLGLDNITVLDRSKPLPEGMVLEQSDGTGWMGMFCLQLMRIALELARENPAYEALATKFFQHYILVAGAMKHMSPSDQPLWDEEDGFFYDLLRCRDGHFDRFRVRSLVGLVPLYAIERLEEAWIQPFAEFRKDFEWYMHHKPIAHEVCHPVRHEHGTTHVLAIMNEGQMRGVLRRLLDPREFMSPFGMRSLSKAHKDEPFRFQDQEVRYEPAESDSKLKGGNSNWRGPIWFPTGFLMVETLRKLGTAYGADLRVPAHGPDGPPRSLRDLAQDLADRMIRIFTRDADGRRPVFGDNARLQDDPHFRDHVLFYEYFHGDTGVGLGASHQTGWTALVASLIDEWRRPTWPG